MVYASNMAKKVRLSLWVKEETRDHLQQKSKEKSLPQGTLADIHLIKIK